MEAVQPIQTTPLLESLRMRRTKTLGIAGLGELIFYGAL